jgi:uncharacterized membrane protein YfcA
MNRYEGPEKFFVYVLVAVLGSTGITTILKGDFTDKVVLISLGITAVTAALVWLKENTPEQPWAKQVIAILGAAVAAFVFAWTDHRIEVAEISPILLAILGAWQVGTVANKLARDTTGQAA